MTDQNSQFFAMLTAVGEAKQANADALGIAWKITHMGVGDANGTDPIPNRLQTALINECRRAPLNQLKVDPSNASIIIAEQVIPEDVGGWWIREIGLYDETGALVAIANCAPSFKPQLSQGSGRTQVVRMNFIVSSAANVELKIDPSVVLATRKYVDDELAKLDHKQSVRYATTAAIALAGLAVQAGGDWAAALTAGDRVLVKNQAAGKDNGIYAVAAGAWLRVADADGSPEVTSGLMVAVEQGTTLADTRWQLVTDGAIVLGTTALVFQNVTQGFAALDSPIFTGDPKAPTQLQFDSSQKLATDEFVQRALGNFSGAASYTGDVILTKADAGKIIRLGGTGYTVTLPLISTLVEGAAFAIQHSGTSAAQTIVTQGADIIDPGTGTITSITLQLGDTAVLVRAAGNWALISGSAALVYIANPTPLQFDTSKKLANMEAVQRALGNSRGLAVGNVNRAMTVADVGCVVLVSPGVTLTLPPANSVPGGSVIHFRTSAGGADRAVVTSGGDTISVGTGSAAILKDGDTLSLASNGSNAWINIGGTAGLGNLAQFGSSIAGSGYQKLPSGLIKQWFPITPGTTAQITYNYPIAFPNGALSWSVGAAGSSGANVVRSGAITSSSIQLTSSNTGQSHFITVIGY